MPISTFIETNIHILLLPKVAYHKFLFLEDTLAYCHEFVTLDTLQTFLFYRPRIGARVCNICKIRNNRCSSLTYLKKKKNRNHVCNIYNSIHYRCTCQQYFSLIQTRGQFSLVVAISVCGSGFPIARNP